MTGLRRGILLGVVGTLVVLIAIALLVIFTGGYNVAATDRHRSLVGWAFDSTMRNSVQGRAGELEPPDTFTEAMIVAGAGEYKSMCEHCHGGVGVEHADWAAVMAPNPPPLARQARREDDRHARLRAEP